MADGDTSAPLLQDSVAGVPELIGVDEMLQRYAGEFGRWQLRHFFLTSLAWALNALHTIVVVFADREPDSFVGPDRSSSTVAEWGLFGPERYKVGLAQSAFFAGAMIGGGVFGHLSDSVLGRKRTLALTCSMNSAFGILTAAAPSFPLYTLLRFLTGLSTGGVGLTAFVLTTEPIGPSARAAAAMSIFYSFSLGSIALAVMAFLNPSWRFLYVASSLPSLLFLTLALPFIHESPRWLLVRGRAQAAMNVMRSIAKTNNKHLPPNVSLALDLRNDAQPKHTSSILDVMASPVARARLALSVAINLLASIAYYGLTLNVRNLGTNLYMSVILNATAEMPAYMLTAIAVKHCGRRQLIVSTMWLTALFCGAAAASPATGVARTACGVLGIFAVCATFNLLYIYVTELFPTTVRSVALGSVTQAGQTGAVVAPMVVVLGGTWTFAVFGACGVVGGMLGLALPETLNQPLYETMEELESEEDGGGFGLTVEEKKGSFA